MTPGIADFLLARIDEDEAHIDGEHGQDYEDCQECAFGSDREPGPYKRPRLRAECDAKRRIVKGMEPYGWIDDINAPEVLGLLVLPYADHPDFREEWRV